MSYVKLCPDRVAYVDVDETLISWTSVENALPLVLSSPKGFFTVYPMLKNIELMRELRAVGWEIVVWSQGGADHAERVVQLLGIEHLVDVIISKPSIYVDDLPFEQQMIKRVYKS